MKKRLQQKLAKLFSAKERGDLSWRELAAKLVRALGKEDLTHEGARRMKTEFEKKWK